MSAVTRMEYGPVSTSTVAFRVWRMAMAAIPFSGFLALVAAGTAAAAVVVLADRAAKAMAK